MRRSRPVRLIQLCRCISTTPDSGAYWRLGFRSSRPSAASTVRFGNHCSDSGGSSTRSGATCRTRRAREHGHLVAGASETRDCGCQRRPDHASLLASPDGGVPGHVTVRGRRRACPYPARGFGCKGPPPSTADTDRLLLPEIRSTGADSPESVARRIGSRWPGAQPAASSGRGRAAVIEDGRRGTPAPPGRWTWYVRTATGSGTGRAGSARLRRRGRRTIPGGLSVQ